MANSVISDSSVALERHYRTKDLAELWGFSYHTIINLFEHEPGVLRLQSRNDTTRRKYITLSIPASVAARVHERLSLSHQSLQSPRSTARPLRVIRLRDLHRRVPQKDLNVLKLKAR